MMHGMGWHEEVPVPGSPRPVCTRRAWAFASAISYRRRVDTPIRPSFVNLSVMRLAAGSKVKHNSTSKTPHDLIMLECEPMVARLSVHLPSMPSTHHMKDER
jgi:hypothetical protein